MSKKRKHPSAVTRSLSESPSGDVSSASSARSDLSQSGLSQSSSLRSHSSHADASQLESLQPELVPLETLQSDSSESDSVQSDSSQSDASHSEAPLPKRRFTIYDAVAGRVTQAGRVSNTNNTRDPKKVFRPDEVLFKKAGAPIRYEETDYYYAHANLPPDRQLPSGDLLTAIHAYVSELYSTTKLPGDEVDGESVDENEGRSTDAGEGEFTDEARWESMDETALIAFGILMEETARGILGETGDMAFTEAADDGEEEERRKEKKKRKKKIKKLRVMMKTRKPERLLQELHREL